MCGYTSEMIIKELKIKKRTYQDYEDRMEDLVKARLFRLAKNGYVYAMLDSIEQRTEMADKLKERVDGLFEILDKHPEDPKMIYPVQQALSTWNNILDSRDNLLNDTPMLQSFHNFVQYNIEKGHAPEMPTDEMTPRVFLAALPEMISKKK